MTFIFVIFLLQSRNKVVVAFVLSNVFRRFLAGFNIMVKNKRLNSLGINIEEFLKVQGIYMGNRQSVLVFFEFSTQI